jgi:hypothetical protein
LVKSGDDGEEQCVDVMKINRPDDLDHIANLGLTVTDGKVLLAGLQQEIVAAQARSHAVRRPDCRSCGGVCHVKDYRDHTVATLFGRVTLRLPRFRCAGCGGNETGHAWPLHCRSTPELDRLQAHLSAMMPYRVAVDVLEQMFPVDAGKDVETFRRHALKIGEALRNEAVAKPEMAAPSITVTVDSTFIRSCGDDERHLEVRVGNVETDAGGRQVFGAVVKAGTDLEALIRRSLDAVGRTEDTALTAFTDGCSGLRRILADAGVTEAPMLDCWGGRPHGIACQTWVVINQDRSRPCPRLSALASTRPRPSSPCTALTRRISRCCEPISAVRRWRPSSRSFLRPKS